MLTWALGLISIIAIAMAVLIRLASNEGRIHIAFVRYLSAIICIILAATTVSYIGINGVPGFRINAERTIAVKHLGWFLSSNSGVPTISIKPILGGSVKLTPTIDSNLVRSWSVEASGFASPLFLDNALITPRAAAITQPTSLRVILPVEPEEGYVPYLQLDIKDEIGTVKTQYRQGLARNDKLSKQWFFTDPGKPVNLADIPVRNYTTFASIASRTDTLDDEWSKANPGQPLYLRSGNEFPSAAELLEMVTVARIEKGNQRSPLCLLVDPLLASHGAIVTINNRAFSANPVLTQVLKTGDHPAQLRGPAISVPILLPEKVKSEGTRSRLEVLRHPALAWPLPPQSSGESWIFSTGDRTKTPGFTLDRNVVAIPNVLAKVTRDRDGKFSVTGGETASKIVIGKPYDIGRADGGAIVSLENRNAAAPWMGAIGLLALATAATVFFIWLSRFDAGAVEPSTVLFSLYFWLIATLVTVRAIVAYRVGLWPPSDAAASEVAAFSSAPMLAKFALFLPTAIGVVALAITPHSGRRRSNFNAKYRGLHLLLTLSAILFTVLGLVGILRLQWATFPSIALLLLGLTSLVLELESKPSMAQGEPEQPPASVSAYPWYALLVPINSPRGYRRYLTVLCIAVLLLVLLDPGIAISATGFLLAVALLSIPIRDLKKKRAGREDRFVIGVLACLAILACMVPLSKPLLRIASAYGPPTVQRLAHFHGLTEQIMAEDPRFDREDYNSLRNTDAQTWQMKLYAALGKTERPGYTLAPLANEGMTYGTMLSDAAFAVFILGEHGPWAGFWLVSLYATLAIALLGYAITSYRADGNWGFPLIAAAGWMTGFPAVYMALANIEAVPFTGQNIPLLTLTSQGELLIAFILGLLLAYIVPRHRRASSKRPALVPTHVITVGLSISLLIVGSFFLLGKLLSLGREHTREYRLSDSLRARLESRIQSSEVTLDDQLVARIKPGSSLGPLEREQIRQYNARSDKTSPGGGLFYARPGRRTQLAINPNALTLPAPQRTNLGPRWQGDILATGSKDDVSILSLTTGSRYGLTAAGNAQMLLLNQQGRASGSTMVLASQSRAGLRRYCEVRLQSGHAVASRASGPNWKLLIDGKPANGRTEILPNQIAAVSDSRTGNIFPFTILTDGKNPLLATRWRNGSYERYVGTDQPIGLTFGLARAADSVKLKSSQPLKLTLVLSLHSALDQALQAWVETDEASRVGYKVEDPRAKRVAVAVLDTFDGGVLAIPAFPRIDPTSELGKSLILGGLAQGSDVISNENLKNHLIGSTFKPLSFAASSVSLFGQYDLAGATVSVPNAPNGVRFIAGLDLQRSRRNPSLGLLAPTVAARYSMGEYLTMSRTYPAYITTLIAMAESQSAVRKLLIPSSQADIVMNGRGYKLDLAQESNQLFVGNGRRAASLALRETLLETLFFRQMNNLYDSEYGSAEVDTASQEQAQINLFFPTLGAATKTAQAQNLDFSEILPARIAVGIDQVDDFRTELLTFLIGAGNNRWSNIRIAEAHARIATGRKVRAHLEALPRSATTAMPAPISNPQWRERNILGPLDRAHVSGTSRRLIQPPPGIRMIAKTGTIGEKGGHEDELLVITAGRSNADGSFVAGRTKTMVIYLQKSKMESIRGMRKFEVANRLLPTFYRSL